MADKLLTIALVYKSSMLCNTIDGLIKRRYLVNIFLNLLMKVLQTFWTGPTGYNTGDLINMKGGWLSCEYHWMSWALSCLQAKSVFGEVHLVTDLKGKRILVDELQLPYASVSTSLEGALDHYHPALFSLAKIFTYGSQTEPFLHLDGDVYLWHRPDTSLLSSKLIAQNLDKDLEFYRYGLDDVNLHFTHIPATMLKEHYDTRSIYGSNAGLLGGSDLAFFKLYCEQAFDFVDKNKNDLGKLNPGNLNFIFEQYLFCSLAAEQNIAINYYQPMVDSPVFKDYINFEDWPNVPMIHPVGNFKKYPHVCDHLAKKLRNDYAEYYYRIINRVKSAGADMRSAIYYSPLLELDEVSSSAIDKKVEPSFERTNAAINYLVKVYPDIGQLKTTISLKEFVDQTKILLTGKTEQARLLEIYKLEYQSNILLKKLYANKAATTQLYEAGLKNFKTAQKTFALPVDDLLQIKIGRPEHYKLLKARWDWRLDYKEQVNALIDRNFNAKKSHHPVMLIPGELTGNVKEYYPDELDLIIFNTLKENVTIAALLLKMQDYFSPEEIEDDYGAFKELIINTVKGLVYAGATEIIS